MPNLFDENTAFIAAKYALGHRRIAHHLMSKLVDIVRHAYKKDDIPFFTIMYLSKRFGSRHRAAIAHIIKELEALKFITRFERPAYLKRYADGRYRKEGHAKNFRINFSRMRSWLKQNELMHLVKKSTIIAPGVKVVRTYGDFLLDVVNWESSKAIQKQTEKDRVHFLDVINARIIQVTHRKSYAEKIEGLEGLLANADVFPAYARAEALSMINNAILEWRDIASAHEKFISKPIWKFNAPKPQQDRSADDLDIVVARLDKINPEIGIEAIRELVTEEVRVARLDHSRSRSEAKLEAILSKSKQLVSQIS